MSAFRNIWKIPELRARILFTLGLILLCRLIAVVPTPGLNPAGVSELADLLRSNAAQGGGLLNASPTAPSARSRSGPTSTPASSSSS